MAVLEVTIKGKLKLDDDLVDSFKAQETEDQVRGFMDEAEDVTVTVQKNAKLSQQEADERAARKAAKVAAAAEKLAAEAAAKAAKATAPADGAKAAAATTEPVAAAAPATE
jgi:peptidoglycan hydrolase CwlO-like protein